MALISMFVFLTDCTPRLIDAGWAGVVTKLIEATPLQGFNLRAVGSSYFVTKGFNPLLKIAIQTESRRLDYIKSGLEK